jgi:hypothetical protein
VTALEDDKIPYVPPPQHLIRAADDHLVTIDVARPQASAPSSPTDRQAAWGEQLPKSRVARELRFCPVERAALQETSSEGT